MLVLAVGAIWLNVNAEGVVVDKIGIEERATNWSCTFAIDRPLTITNSQWHPETQPFQPNLGDMIAKGASYVAKTKRITNALNIFWVSLRRLPLSKRQFLASGLSSNQIENTWFLESVFYVHDYGDDEMAAMKGPIYGASVSFLDGTFAKPYTNHKKTSRSGPGVPSRKDSSKTLLPFAAKRHEMTGENPWDKLIQPNFQLSTVTWNGFQNPFPLDFPKEIANCKLFLSNQGFSFTNLHLTEIKMEPFTENDLVAHGLGPVFPQIHWLTTFDFAEKEDPVKRFQVHMLLDGRIVGYFATADDRKHW